jgi:hypothetical protein
MNTTRPDQAAQTCTASLSIPATYANGPLFQACPGIPAKEALETASIYLSIAADLAQNAANSSSDEKDAGGRAEQMDSPGAAQARHSRLHRA